jgi:hypothetical protein
MDGLAALIDRLKLIEADRLRLIDGLAAEGLKDIEADWLVLKLIEGLAALGLRLIEAERLKLIEGLAAEGLRLIDPL